VVDDAEFEERLREASALAETLVGLTVEEATELIAERGFRAEVVPPGWLVPADLDARRIVLVPDDAGVVTRASGG
jgi:hypothetical protein